MLVAKSPDRIFTVGFVLVGLATLAQASSLMLVNTSIGLLVVREFGLGPQVVGAVIGIQATCALVSRFPVGSWSDRYGSRLFAFGGAALMVVSCVTFILAMSIRAAIPIGGGVPILLVLACMLSGVALGTFSTAASTYIAYTVPASRRAEAVGYYGILQGLAQGFGAGVSIVIRRGRFAAIVPGMIVTALGMYLVSRAASAEAFILAGVAVGFGFATAQPALQALAIDLAGPAERGTAMATFWAFTDVGVISGSFVSGQIAAVSGLGAVFVVSAVMPLVGVAGLLAWRQLSRPASLLLRSPDLTV